MYLTSQRLSHCSILVAGEGVMVRQLEDVVGSRVSSKEHLDVLCRFC